MDCPLCTEKARIYSKDELREYFSCERCSLIFVPPRYHLSKEKEKERYDNHENSPVDKGYRKFLSKVSLPLIDILPKNACGLDFGCGPGPTLSLMMESNGFQMEIYDPFYYPQKKCLEKTYDFITSTEVVEHLSNPRKELRLLDSILNDKGYIALMTSKYNRGIEFETWYYKKDPSHICFYSEGTMQFIATLFNYKIVYSDDSVTIFNK